MIEYRQGNIFEDNAEAIVNTVNCVGVMGRGIALQCKNMYPDNFKAYEKACKSGAVVPGRMFVYDMGSFVNPRYVINFPTKRHWRHPSRLEDIEAGLVELVAVVKAHGIKTVAVPPLGCGNGGLNWSVVRPIISNALDAVPDAVFHVYEPAPQGAHVELPQKGNLPRMTVGRAALIGLMNRYLEGLLDTEITLLEVHKLMYFMQEAGMELKLKFTRAHYGPYAENLGQVLKHVENYYIHGYEDGGDAPRKTLTLMPSAVPAANEILNGNQEVQQKMQRVFELIDGYETTDGMELLATVHWTVKKENIVEIQDIINFVHSWNEHKRQFTDNQIIRTYQHLRQYGWL